MSTSSVLVVIPARGGSKGLPGKNIAPIAGVPLIGRTVRAALDASRVSRVVVSTDDDEIADAARQHGAEVVRRPAELSSDTALSESAVLHVLGELERQEGYFPEWTVLAQCTSPFTAAGDFDAALEEVERAGADSGFTASRFCHFVWQRTQGGAVGLNHDGGPRKRRQDIQPQYLENGAVYVFRTTLFKDSGFRFCGRTVIVEVPPEHTFEIDVQAELIAARALASARGESSAIERHLPPMLEAVFLDFDGVLTDDRVHVDQNGVESVACSRADGLGIAAVRRLGIPIVIVSKERNPVVQRRAEKLKVECFQATDDKVAAMREWLKRNNANLENTVFVGNDINDLAAIDWVPTSFCPIDACEAVKHAVTSVLGRPGGCGAVRELCDAIVIRFGSHG